MATLSMAGKDSFKGAIPVRYEGIRQGMQQRKRDKVEKTMHEWKAGTLHSGSKHGPPVRDKRQAIAIALNQARRRRTS